MALYTQGTQKIVVVVRKEGAVGVQKGTGQSENVSSSNTTKEKKTGATSKTSKRFEQIQTTHAMAVAKQIGQQFGNYYIGGVGIRNGDQAYEDTVRREVEIAGDVANLLTSAAIGATYGAGGGPVGMAFGALFNTISTGTSIGFKYLNREREFNAKMFVLENGIEYQRARASISLTTGRLR